MTTAPERPLVPTEREASAGRRAEEPTFGDARVVVATEDPYASVEKPRGLGRLARYVGTLRITTLEGPKIPLVVAILTGAITQIAFQGATLALPEIQIELGIDLASVVSVLALTGAPLQAARVWVGHLADRVSRVWLLRVGTMLRAAGFALIGIAGALPFYAFGRLAEGASTSVTEPSNQTVFVDYYSLTQRFRAIFLLFQYSAIINVAAFPLVANGIEAFGWRGVYVGLGVVSALVVALQFFMKEPVRGYWDRRALGATDEAARVEQAPLSFSHAFRTAWSVRYLRTLCLVSPAIGMISLLSVPISQTYLASRFGLGLHERGYLGMLPAAASAIGLLVIAPHVSRMLGERPRAVVVIQSAQFLVTAALYSVLLLREDLTYAITILTLVGLVTGLAFPLTFQLQQLTIPPRMRGFGLQVTYLFSAPAGIVISVLFGNVRSFGGIVTIIAVLSVVAALALLTTLPHVERDIANARISSMADEELRRYKESGRNALLLCRKVDVAYGGVHVLFGVDLEVAPGEVVALLGTNGAGKSTLLRAISGVTEPVGGAIYLDGVDITHRAPHESAAAGVVVVPGGRGVCQSLSVRENLRLAAWLRRGDDAYVEERTAAALDLFPRLRERLDAGAGDLSGGEQQMLAIAQSYLMEPRLLMIDELSLGLAPQVVESLLDSLRAINETGTTIILVEQSINVALTIADRAVFMDKGEIRFDGSTADLLSRPDLVRSVFMGGAATTGRGRRRVVRGPDDGGEGLLDVERVGVSFGAVRALHDVSLQVAPREIVGIIGPNGAGKTTLFDAISGLVATDGGHVRIKGVDVTGMSLDRRALAGLGRSFQNARLFPSLTVRENIAVAMQKRIASRNPLLAALWAPPARVAERKANERIDDIVELLGLGAFADKFVGELSTGSRRAVDVGCIMVASPDLLLLDEPSSGLAQAETEALGPVIQRIVRETGCGVVVIEHDLPLVTSVSDRLVAMELGRVIATGTPEEVTTHPEVRRAYLSASRDVLLRSDSSFSAALAAAGLEDS